MPGRVDDRPGPPTAAGGDEGDQRRRSARGAALVSLGQRVDPDGLVAFRAAVVAVRWAAVTASLALGLTQVQDLDTAAVAAACTVAVATAVVRTLRPLRDTPGSRYGLELAAEAGLVAVAILLTGGFGSPFVFLVIPLVVVAGFARGLSASVPVAVGILAVVGVVDAVADDGTEAAAVVAVGGQALLVAVVASWARRLASGRDAERPSEASETEQLEDANTLLVELHALAQTLPSSLDLDEALDALVRRIEALLAPDGVQVLLRDDTDGAWQVVRRTGGSTTALRHGTVQLPRLGYDAVRDDRVVHDEVGLAAPLTARGAIIGVVVVDSARRGDVRNREAQLLAELVAPAAVAVDNARWFTRLRTVGAEEERSRIARDLHDRIGQSLAYLAFELDRLVRKAEKGQLPTDELAGALDQLRGDTRSVIREVRDTLYDLRTDVTEERGLAAVLGDIVERVRQRSGLEVVFDPDEPKRAPLPQEKELLRIAQEALHNVERHARAHQVVVTWRCDERRAELVVADDGIGLPSHGPRSDAYGLAGMRERAASIGARLSVESTPGTGATVRCALERHPRTTGAGHA